MRTHALLLVKKGVTYSLYLIAATAGILYLVFWLPFSLGIQPHKAAGYYQMPEIRHVSPLLLQQVGSLFTGKHSSFIHFGKSPAAGMTRVCALGDSFTYGEEVGEGIDYPSHLQGLFEQNGFADIEVINFGNNWHGFHQTFAVWQGLARDMGCQYVTLGPHTFFTDRDSRFNHTLDREPSYLHSLFVLEDDDSLRRIDIHGDTPEARVNDYYRFFPNLRLLPYDNQMPPVVRAIMKTVAPGKEVPNPWYYTDDPESTLRQTWKQQIDAIAADSRQVVLFHYWGVASNLALETGRQNIAVASPGLYSGFPYRMAGRHNSGWGNYLLAQHYFAALTNNPDFPTDIIRPVAMDPQPSFLASNDALAVSELASLSVMIDGTPAGHFIHTYPTTLRKWVPEKSDAHALIFLTPAGESPIHGMALVIRKPIADGSQLNLRFGDGPAQPIGPLQRLSPRLPLYTVAIPASSVTPEDIFLMDPQPWHSGEGPVPAFQLTVDGEPVLDGRPYADQFRLVPVNGELLRAVADRNAFLNPDSLPDTGSITLEATDKAGNSLSIPVSGWKKVRHPLPTLLQNTAYPIQKPL